MHTVTAVNGNFVACCSSDITVDAGNHDDQRQRAAERGRQPGHDRRRCDDYHRRQHHALRRLGHPHIAGAMTLTRGTSIPEQSLGLGALPGG